MASRIRKFITGALAGVILGLSPVQAANYNILSSNNNILESNIKGETLMYLNKGEFVDLFKNKKYSNSNSIYLKIPLNLLTQDKLIKMIKGGKINRHKAEIQFINDNLFEKKDLPEYCYYIKLTTTNTNRNNYYFEGVFKNDSSSSVEDGTPIYTKTNVSQPSSVTSSSLPSNQTHTSSSVTSSSPSPSNNPPTLSITEKKSLSAIDSSFKDFNQSLKQFNSTLNEFPVHEVNASKLSEIKDLFVTLEKNYTHAKTKMIYLKNSKLKSITNKLNFYNSEYTKITGIYNTYLTNFQNISNNKLKDNFNNYKQTLRNQSQKNFLIDAKLNYSIIIKNFKRILGDTFLTLNISDLNGDNLTINNLIQTFDNLYKKINLNKSFANDNTRFKLNTFFQYYSDKINSSAKVKDIKITISNPNLYYGINPNLNNTLKDAQKLLYKIQEILVLSSSNDSNITNNIINFINNPQEDFNSTTLNNPVEEISKNNIEIIRSKINSINRNNVNKSFINSCNEYIRLINNYIDQYKKTL